MSPQWTEIAAWALAGIIAGVVICRFVVWWEQMRAWLIVALLIGLGLAFWWVSQRPRPPQIYRMLDDGKGGHVSVMIDEDGTRAECTRVPGAHIAVVEPLRTAQELAEFLRGCQGVRVVEPRVDR